MQISNVTIKKICKICIITILAICALVITFISAVFIFIAYLITKDAGKLNNVEKISGMVTENQETLQDIVSQVLKPEQDLEIVINIEEKYFQGLGSSRGEDERQFNLEDIYCVSEKLEIKRIRGYKDSDVDMVIFITYASGIVSSGEIKGFFYLEQDMTEDIFEYNFFKPYYIDNYGEITDNWYYFDMSC